MLTKSNHSGAVGGQVFRLRSKPTVRSREEEVFGDETIERSDVGRQLSITDLRFAGDNLRILNTDKNRLHHIDV